MSTTSTPDPWQSPTVRNYWLLCLATLVALTLVLVGRGLGAWSLLPMLVGAVSLAGRWRCGPLLSLLASGWLIFFDGILMGPLDPLNHLVLVLRSLMLYGRGYFPDLGESLDSARQLLPLDLVLCAALLAYCMAHYRLLGLAKNIFPGGPARPTVRQPAPASSSSDSCRSEQTVTHREIVRLLLAAPALVVFAAICWTWLSRRESPTFYLSPSLGWIVAQAEGDAGEHVSLHLSPPVWQAVILVWILAFVLVGAGSLIGFLVLQRMSSSEAGLFLLDTVWRDTCREQRLLNRWFIRTRFRRERRKEKP